MLTRRRQQLKAVKEMIAADDSGIGNLLAFAEKLLVERKQVTTIADFKAMTDAIESLRKEAWERANGNKRRISLVK